MCQTSCYSSRLFNNQITAFTIGKALHQLSWKINIIIIHRLIVIDEFNINRKMKNEQNTIIIIKMFQKMHNLVRRLICSLYCINTQRIINAIELPASAEFIVGKWENTLYKFGRLPSAEPLRSYEVNKTL